VSVPATAALKDTFYVGTLKGVGHIYQQTFIDTYAKVAFAKLYDRKTPITAADLLNDRVVPFFDEHEIKLSRMLTDRGTEFCGGQSHEYELYLAVKDIDHSLPRQRAHKPMAFVSASTGRCWMSSTAWRSARRSIARLTNCRPISMLGSLSTMNTARIKGAGVSAKPQCRLSLTPSLSQRRRSWQHDNIRHALQTDAVRQMKC
jgi:hypothetical protein